MRLRTAALVLVPLLAVVGCGSADSNDSSTGSPSATTPAVPGASSPTSGQGTLPSSATCSYPADGPAAKSVNPPPATLPTGSPTTLTISTSAGDIPVKLDDTKAPCTVNSFLSLAAQGYYDNTTCHRLITAGAFILQCGDPTATGTGGPGYSYADELVPNDPRLGSCDTFGCTYTGGTLAMANSGPDTNGSQFFLVYGDSTFPPNYTVFGRMSAAGLKVVEAIGAAGVDQSVSPGSPEGPPAKPVTITAVK